MTSRIDTYEIKDTEDWVVFPNTSETDDNAYFLARKKIQMDDVPKNAVLHICAQAQYIFYLNGELLGQGPVTATDLTCYYDSYDVSDKLKAGTNYLALEVHYPGTHFRTCVPGIPAFWCRFTPESDCMDNAWQVCPDPSRIPNAPEFTFQLGYTVFRDMRMIPAGWQCFEDDFSGWQNGEVFSNPNKIQLLPRDIPSLTADIIRPAELVECGLVPANSADPRQQDFAALISSESHKADSKVFDQLTETITNFPDGSGAYLIYDFGREVYGSVSLNITAGAGTVLDIVYGEMLENGRLEAYYPFGERRPRAITKSDGHRFADRHILAEGGNGIEIRLQERGFRYAQLVFRNYDHPVKLNDFTVENRVYPIGEEGKFHSDNQYYNELWQMCSHTVRHCVGDRFMDCPWREQAFWINDFLVANLYYFNLTSDSKLPLHCLKLAFDGFMKYGAMPAVYPAGDPLFFPSMPALWTLTLYDYFLYSGDEDGLLDLLPAMDSILGEYDELALDDGLIPNHETWWNFIDIGYMDAGIELKGCTSVLNSIVAAAFKCAAELHNDSAQAEVYARRSQQICNAMKSKLWDSENKRFRDSTEAGFGLETFSVHPHAILLLFDLMPEDNAMLAEVLTAPGSIPAEPYFQRFVLEALAKIGRHDLAEKTIESLWRKMVDSKSPTVWEIAFKGPKTKGISQSLCHAFSCAPLAYASRTIAGIIPLKPGFKEFLFSPVSSSVVNFACSQPTPYGVIKVIKAQDSIEITVPDGTVAILPDDKKLNPGKHIIESMSK
jgi:hypothetical protein